MEDGLEGQGSEEVVEQEETVAPETDDSQGGGLNPAWSELLDKLPTSLHSLVTPTLSKWDRNHQESINKVHSQYEPWKNFNEKGLQPDQLDYAWQVYQAIETRPQDVLKSLQEYMDAQNPEKANVEQQGLGDETEEIPQEFLNHPEFQRMNQMVETMAQLLVQQKTAEAEAQADQELEQEISSLKEKHGDFDVDMVLRHALTTDGNIEKALEEIRAYEQKVLSQQRKPGPKVLGAGGTAPNSQMDVKKLDDKGRRNLVAEMLKASAEQS